MIVGLHISHFTDLLKTIKSYHGKLSVNCFQFFLSSPKRKLIQVAKKKLDEMDAIREYVQKNKIKLFIHTSYTLNFAQKTGKMIDSYWIESLIKELKYAQRMGVEGCVLHLGKALELSKKDAYANMYKSIKKVLDYTPDNLVKILLETSSGQGTELGYDLKEFAEFFKSFPKKYKERLGVCVDTCHVFSAGYDLRTKENVAHFFKLLNKLFDIKNIKLIHFNDSQKKFNSRVDRHELVLKGTIGKGLKYVAKYAIKLKIPLIFETPRDNFKLDLNIIKKEIILLNLSKKV